MERCSSHLTLHKNLNWKGPFVPSVHFLQHTTEAPGENPGLGVTRLSGIYLGLSRNRVTRVRVKTRVCTQKRTSCDCGLAAGLSSRSVAYTSRYRTPGTSRDGGSGH